MERIEYKKCQSQEEAFNLIGKDQIAEILKELGIKAEVKASSEDHSLMAQGKGFQCKVIFEDTHAAIDLTLSLLLKPLKGQVLKVIRKKVHSIL